MGLITDNKVKNGKYFWQFGDVKKLEFENDNYFCSTLKKFDQLSTNEINSRKLDLFNQLDNIRNVKSKEELKILKKDLINRLENICNIKFDEEFKERLIEFERQDNRKTGRLILPELLTLEQKLEKVLPYNTEYGAKFLLSEMEYSLNAESRFFIHVKSGVIAFEPGKINPNQFSKNFSKVFEEGHLPRKERRVEIHIIAKEEEFLGSINQFNIIQNVEIILLPPNPSSRRIYEELHIEMVNDGIAKSKETIEIKSDRDGKELIQRKNEEGDIAMASDGLGKVKVKGTITTTKDKHSFEINEKTISTSDYPETTEAPQDSDSNESILEKLIIAFKKILNRFKKVEVN